MVGRLTQIGNGRTSWWWKVGNDLGKINSPPPLPPPLPPPPPPQLSVSVLDFVSFDFVLQIQESSNITAFHE